MVSDLVALLGFYLMMGVAISLVWSRRAWHTADIKRLMKVSGYKAAKEEVKTTRNHLIGFWPILLPMWVYGAISSAMENSADPHIEHQTTYAARLKTHHETAELERKLGQEVSVQIPQPWCACQSRPRNIERDRQDQLTAAKVRNLMGDLDRRIAGPRKDAYLKLSDVQRLQEIQRELNERGIV